MSRQDPPEHPAFVVHELSEAIAALRAAAALDTPVTLVSPPAAGVVQGALWFQTLVGRAAAEVPRARFQATIDCGDHAGRALESLSLGLEWVVFLGPEEVAKKIAAIAEAQGARLTGERPRTILPSHGTDLATSFKDALAAAIAKRPKSNESS